MMELDVHLSRVGEEPWGFRLIGGVDFGMPLTVVKVLPNSPADKAGLQNGDTVSRINDVVATEMSHEDSRQAVAAASDYLSLGVTRGLYDPVLDDYDPIYDPIDQDDFDQPSRPTEVQFEPKEFTDEPQINEKPHLDTYVPPEQIPDFYETPKLSQSRSLTASPFIPPTKPYRPFSTEPLDEIPPLEDPIILNPDYHDEFSKLGIDEDFLPKTRFKLPISEQYDPDGTKRKTKCESVGREDNKETKLEETQTEIRIENISQNTLTEMKKDEVSLKTSTEVREKTMSNEESKFMENMKQEIDLEKIELTASNIVDETISKAVIVVEEIKKEIDVELKDSCISKLESQSTVETKQTEEGEATTKQQKDLFKSKADLEDVKELAGFVDETTEKISKQSESKVKVNVAKEVEKFESVEKQQQSVEERQRSAKIEIEEAVEAGSVKRKSMVFDKEIDSKTSAEKKDVQRKTVGESKTESFKQKEKSSDTIKKTQSVKAEQTTYSDTKMSTTRLLSEQRAYTLGLQTIPNIRGTVHSSYHYNLLLKTFFIHLTDVMVALSRFILSEPVLSKEPEVNQEVNDLMATEKIETKTVSDNREETAYGEIFEATENKVQEQKIKNDTIESKAVTTQGEKVDEIKESTVKENQENYAEIEVDKMEERRKLSGSKMAQLAEKKSEQLIQSMGVVISEFQNKAGIEDTLEVKERRSRSRSKIEEQVMKESDPLEWLAKIDSQKTSQTTETKTSTEVSSSVCESNKKKNTDSSYETNELTSSKSKEGKSMYIAIVEAHVYTNKDAILDEQVTEMFENASVQSAEETNIALDAIESVSSERVAMQNSKVHKEIAKTVEVSSDIVKETAKTEAAAKIVEELQKFQHTNQDFQESDQTSIEKEFKHVTETTQEKDLEQLVQPEAAIMATKSDIKQQATIVEEGIKMKETLSKSIVEDNITAVAVAERPTTLDLKLDEDPHIVKKKPETEVKLDEDPHIVKKRSEVEQEKSSHETHFKATATAVSEISAKSEQNTFAALKVTKQHVTEAIESVELSEKTNKGLAYAEVSESESKSYQSFETKMQENKTKQNLDTQIVQESTFTVQTQNLESQQNIQESTYVAKSTESIRNKSQNLSLNTELAEVTKSQSQTAVLSEVNNNIDTPTPSTVPSTPLTDEYIFKLEIPFPKGITPIPQDPSPVDEDPHIVKKNLVPHIDSTVEEGVIFDPPLPTPPGSKVTSPVYTKPGLRGGADRREISKEEILEIERKSTLLASAIDETIKSIEEYKEEVGIETRRDSHEKDGAVIYNGYAKVIETKVFNAIEESKLKMEENSSETEKQIDTDNTDITENFQNKIVSELEDNIDSKTDTQINNDAINTDSEVNITEEEGQNKRNPLEGYRPVEFNPEEIQNVLSNLRSAQMTSNDRRITESQIREMYKTETGELIGSNQGIVDGLEEAVVDNDVAKELGKPGMTEEKIAELISGESEMLREAHVMGIKPIMESLNHSEVLKALNEELIRTREEKKKKEERKWTTFLQKPKRPPPRAKFGYHGYVDAEEEVKEPYKVKIVKQPKPKVAPDYKSEDFNTGLLPWEERALREPTPPPVAPEDPILIPEEPPVLLEAVDPLPESEVPDLEDSGIPLPSPKPDEPELEQQESDEEKETEEKLDIEAVIEETEKIVEENLVEEMDQSKLAEQLMASVSNMVDPNASLEQQLAQMRAQLAALAQLPCVIQQSLELVTRQLSHLSHMETSQAVSQVEEITEANESTEVTQNHCEIQELTNDQQITEEQNQELKEQQQMVETVQEVKPSVTEEEIQRMRKEEEEMLEEQRRIEKQKKELMDQMRIEQEARQLKQRPTPRVGKPKPVFGPITPQERPLVLPGGRKWRKPKDAYNEQFITETLAAQAEIISGKAKGCSYESVRLPYDERINFMKYEKPPISLDHLKDSDVYKMIHNMEQMPGKRVEMLTPVVAEADYREKCRSMTPCDRMAMEEHLDIPEQVQP